MLELCLLLVSLVNCLAGFGQLLRGSLALCLVGVVVLKVERRVIVLKIHAHVEVCSLRGLRWNGDD